jgi:hypothetical protein
MNFKINIWELNVLFKSEKYYFNSENYIDYKNWHFNFEYLYMNVKIYISNLKNNHLNFK